jgi:hypothetical protein
MNNRQNYHFDKSRSRIMGVTNDDIGRQMKTFTQDRVVIRSLLSEYSHPLYTY